MINGNSSRFRKSEKIKVVCRFCGSSNVVKFGYYYVTRKQEVDYISVRIVMAFTPTSK